MIRSTGKK
ncbi:hypothetical protein LINGRAPRIM_LOCUS969 [Linum grandiflorum]